MPIAWRDAIPSAAVLALFASALPVQLPEPDAAISKTACLTLAERAPADPMPAVSTIERCLALYPDDVELLEDLAASTERADPAGAEAALRRAIRLDSTNGDLRLRLGRLLLERGAAADALAEASAGLRVQPNRPELLELRRAAGAESGKGS
ncbi:MAG: hypothetical protein IT176_00040 [Acidobacteria bacterium]|nr:hypothetical protein [Acidobacteriota bacterium]